MAFGSESALQVGVECAGDIAPGLAMVLGWAVHHAGSGLQLGITGPGGGPLPLRSLALTPRPDLPAGPGRAVTGFAAVHETPPGTGERVLVVGEGEDWTSLDLTTPGLPSDVPAVLAARDDADNFELLREAAWDPERLPLLDAAGPPFGPFAGWVARLPRIEDGLGAVPDLRRLAAVALPDGEVALAGTFEAAAGAAEVDAFAVITPTSGPPGLAPLRDARVASFRGGFALHGYLPAAALGEAVALLALVRRGHEARALLVTPGAGEALALLDAVALTGMNLLASDMPGLQRWVEAVLAVRLEALRPALTGMEVLRGGKPAGPRTALAFEVEEPDAARLLILMAPALEAAFGRIVLSGAAAGRAASALAVRGSLEVRVEEDPAAALTAAATDGTVTLFDAAALASAAIEEDLGRRAALDGTRLGQIAALHAAAGTGGMGRTLQRVCALLDAADTPWVPAVPRGDAVGGLIAAHLNALWQAAGG